jgi:D-alanyl-D-alanine carboxypeptidase (penicillin-binding protein 5/6)
MMQRPPPYVPSEGARRWKRRQQRLLILLAVLLVLEVALVTRGIMLLPSDKGGAALAHPPTATATRIVSSPTATPALLPPAPSIQATAGMVIDLSNRAMLFHQNADEQLPMASTTKIMTLLVALEYGRPRLNAPVTIGADAVAAGRGENSHMGVSVGEVLSLRDLLYGMMLPSGDDAAVAVADAIAGSVPAFVALMNARAQYLGLTHTHYVNSNGLDAPGHYTSASDLLKLTAFALGVPGFAEIVATPEYVIPLTSQHKGYDLQNTNALLGPGGYDGADGVKTGTTGNAGDCLVFSATRGNTHLLGVLLGDPTDGARYQDARALLDWGFSAEHANAGG